MNSRFVTLESSSMAHKDKIQNLSQEVVRRLSRMDQRISLEERNKVLDIFSDKIMRSGYRVIEARKIFVSGIRCYKRKLLEAEQAGRDLNRRMTCPSNRLKILIKKKTEKIMWYKPNPDRINTEQDKVNQTTKKPRNTPDLRKTASTVNIPRTQDGYLVKLISEMEME